MSVSKIMTSRVVSVEPDDTLAEVKRIFDSVSFRHLLVVDKAKLVGIISDRDLLRAISPGLGTAAETTKDLAYLNRKAHQIMTRNPSSLKANQTLKSALDLFGEGRFSCIPIVDDDNRPVGIVSWRDIIQAINHRWPT